MSIIKINGAKPNKEESYNFEFSNENKKKLEKIELKRRSILAKTEELELIRDQRKFNWNFGKQNFYDVLNIILTIFSVVLVIIDLFEWKEIPTYCLIGFPVASSSIAIRTILINKYYQKS